MHKALVEAAAENDETLMEKFFELESLTEDEMREGIRKGLAARGMFPVFCVCAGKDMGVRRLMELVTCRLILYRICLWFIIPVVFLCLPMRMALLLFISSRLPLNPISVVCSILK